MDGWIHLNIILTETLWVLPLQIAVANWQDSPFVQTIHRFRGNTYSHNELGARQITQAVQEGIQSSELGLKDASWAEDIVQKP